MGTAPIIGMDLCPKDRSPSLIYISIRGSESKSEPMEKSCVVQESVSESESENGNKLKNTLGPDLLRVQLQQALSCNEYFFSQKLSTSD